MRRILHLVVFVAFLAYVLGDDVNVTDQYDVTDNHVNVTDLYGVTDIATTKAPPPVSPYVCNPPAFWKNTSHPSWPFFAYTVYSSQYRVVVLTPFVLLGNTVAFLGSVRRASSSSPHFLMSALAVADLLALSLRSSLAWFQRYKVPMTDPGCAVLYLFAYTWTMVALWLVVFMTVERLIIITFPLRASRYCTHRRAVLATAFLYVFFTVTNLSYIHHAVHPQSNLFCKTNGDLPEIIGQMHSIFTSVVVSYLPIIIIFIANIGILVQFRQARERQKQMTSDSSKSEKQERQLTNMMILVSTSFLILTLPSAMQISVLPARSVAVMRSCEYYAWWVFAGNVSAYTLDINNCINGYLYCISSSRFRNDFFNMITCGRFVKARRERTTRQSALSTSGSQTSAVAKSDN